MIGLWGGIADLTAAAEQATKSAHAAREAHVESLRNLWIESTHALCKKESEQGTSSEEQAATYATYDTYVAARDAASALRATR